MAQLATIFIFCALLINIDANDHVKNRHAHSADARHAHSVDARHAHSANTRHAQHADARHAHPAVIHAQRAHKIQNRDNNENENCTCDDSEDLKFYFNSSSGIIGIYNSQASVGLVIDIKAHLVVIFNEKSHLVIVINYQNQTGILINSENVTITFNSLIHLESLTIIYNDGKENGTPFNLDSIPGEVSKQIEPILKGLNPNYKSLSDLIKDIQCLAKSVSNLGSTIGNGRGEFRGDFSLFVQRLQGLYDLLAKANGGLNGIEQRHFTLNTSTFLEASTGLDALINVIRQLSGSFDLRTLFSNLNSRQWLSIIAGFGGSSRFDETWRVFSQLAQLSQNNGSSNSSALVNTLIPFFTSAQSNSSFSFSQWQTIIRNAAQQLGGIGANGGVSGLSDLLRNITSRQGFDINGINFSRILDILLNPDPRGSIYNIEHILTLFTHLFPLPEGIANLIVSIFHLLTLPNRIFTLKNLFALITPSIIEPMLNTLRTILKVFIQIMEFEHNVFVGLAKFWSNIPGIGVFMGPMDEALAIFTQGGVTLGKIFASEDARRLVCQGLSGMLNSTNSGNESESGNQTGDPSNIFQGFVNATGGGSGPGGIFNFLNEKNHPKPDLHKERHNLKGKEKKHERHHQ